MSTSNKMQRIRERLELKLPVRVHCRETPDFEWTELTRLTDVTPFGAGFTLKRPTERGRLLHMTIPMPRQLRVFDHVEDQYRIWAIVRYARPIASPEGKTLIFEVGVAFVGKRPPASFDENPAIRYEIADRAAAGGALSISERSDDSIQPLEISDKRAPTRHNIPAGVLLEILSEKGGVDHTEESVTENVSRKGAAVFTELNLPVGRFIRLTSLEYKLTVHAVVRGHSRNAAGMPRIHVEFVDREWPVY